MIKQDKVNKSKLDNNQAKRNSDDGKTHLKPKLVVNSNFRK